MSTTNLGLDNSLTQLTEGQEQKEAAINSNTTILLSNMDTLDTTVPIFMGEFPSAPASGTVALGSTYYNTGDSTLYHLKSQSPDVWISASGGGSTAWGGITGTLSDQTDLQSALDGKLGDITGESIKDLSDVSSGMTPVDGQVLTFDTTNGWQAESVSGGSTAVDVPFRPKVIQRFGKTNSGPFPNVTRSIWSATQHSPEANIIVNLYTPIAGSSANTLSVLKVDGSVLTPSISDTVTFVDGTGVCVDVSGDGNRVAVCTDNAVWVLTTSDSWASFNTEQKITLADPDENITSAALNSDGSLVYIATGNKASSGTVTPKIVTWTRSGATWSAGTTIFSDSVGATNNLMLMHGNQSDTVVGFQKYTIGSETSPSLHVYQDSGGWSEIWTKASVSMGSSVDSSTTLSCISADGDNVFYKTSDLTLAVDITILTSAQTVAMPENLANERAGFVMTADGHNFIYDNLFHSATANGGKQWLQYRVGSTLHELGFGSTNWVVNKSYSNGEAPQGRPSKTGCHYMFGTTFKPYADDALIPAIAATDWVDPSVSINY